MAIEPISSIMTVQAQGSVQRPQAPVQAEKPESVSDSVQAAVKVDKTISVVENAQEKGRRTAGISRARTSRPLMSRFGRQWKSSTKIWGILRQCLAFTRIQIV